jgi:hypothetical protein
LTWRVREIGAETLTAIAGETALAMEIVVAVTERVRTLRVQRDEHGWALQLPRHTYYETGPVTMTTAMLEPRFRTHVELAVAEDVDELMEP